MPLTRETIQLQCRSVHVTERLAKRKSSKWQSVPKPATAARIPRIEARARLAPRQIKNGRYGEGVCPSSSALRGVRSAIVSRYDHETAASITEGKSLARVCGHHCSACAHYKYARAPLEGPRMIASRMRVKSASLARRRNRMVEAGCAFLRGRRDLHMKDALSAGFVFACRQPCRWT